MLNSIKQSIEERQRKSQARKDKRLIRNISEMMERNSEVLIFQHVIQEPKKNKMQMLNTLQQHKLHVVRQNVTHEHQRNKMTMTNKLQQHKLHVISQIERRELQRNKMNMMKR